MTEVEKAQRGNVCSDETAVDVRGRLGNHRQSSGGIYRCRLRIQSSRRLGTWLRPRANEARIPQANLSEVHAVAPPIYHHIGIDKTFRAAQKLSSMSCDGRIGFLATSVQAAF